MSLTRVSSKYQVVIPKQVRESVALKQGQELYAYPVKDGVFLSPRKKWPNDYIGSEQEIWSKIDIAKYLQEEKNSWD